LKGFAFNVDRLSLDVDNGIGSLLDKVASDLGSFLKKEFNELCDITNHSSLTA